MKRSPQGVPTDDFLAEGHNLEHVLAGLILLGRVGDLLSTYLATPTLQLEANPFVRRLRWPFAVLSVALCLVPYYNTALAVMVLVPSLLVTAANLSRGWVVRALGERKVTAMLERAARRTSLRTALFFVVTPGCFVALIGLVPLVMSGSQRSCGDWFALGLILYGFVVGLYSSLFTIRVFGRARATTPARADPP